MSDALHRNALARAWKNATASDATAPAAREPGPARGVLQGAGAAGAFDHRRVAPPVELARWVAHYWRVAWDLGDAPPQLQRTLPHPNVHIVFEAGCTGVWGVPSGRFTKELTGRGRAFGIKFRPGGFAPLFDGAVADIADRVLPLEVVLGAAAAEWEARMLACDDFDAQCALASRMLVERWPSVAPEEAARVDAVAALVDGIVHDRSLVGVDELARRAGRDKRTLQRLFHRYVGASPKWVIQRYRLHEAIEQLRAGEPVPAAELALALGYFDQAHFIKDFKALVGCTPAEYGRAGLTL